jgi:hypothetical protein
MSPINIRYALASLGVLVVLAILPTVHAAPPIQIPVQILDPDGACETWSTGGTLLAPTVTCVKASGGTPAPGVPVCSITANDLNPLNLSAATPVVLKATCTNTAGNTTWTWTGTGAAPSTTGVSPQQQNFTVSATTTFSVVATNASGPSLSRSVTVNITPAAPPPPTGQLSCPGYKNTIVLDFDYVARRQVMKPTPVPFGNGDIVVARFTTPANLANNGSGGFVNAIEYAGLTAFRTGVLSTTPCDFNYEADSSHAQFTNASVGVSATVYFSSSIYGGVVLQPGKTYYFNIKNDQFGTSTCGGSDCPIAVTLSPN